MNKKRIRLDLFTKCIPLEHKLYFQDYFNNLSDIHKAILKSHKSKRKIKIHKKSEGTNEIMHASKNFEIKRIFVKYFYYISSIQSYRKTKRFNTL